MRANMTWALDCLVRVLLLNGSDDESRSSLEPKFGRVLSPDFPTPLFLGLEEREK